RGPAGLEVVERRAAPVAGDRILELLAVAGRAVEVDRDDCEALARIRFGIPAVVELVRHRALRAAMDDESDRILLVRLEADRLDDIALHGVAARALEREPLVVAELDVLEAIAVEARQLLHAAAVRAGRVEIGRMLEVVPRDDHRLLADVEARDGAVAD